MTTQATYFVDDLQACEPDALKTSPAIRVELADELDGMGFHRATVYGPTREAVVEYVRENWGDEDGDWFREWVEDRVEVTFNGETIREMDERVGPMSDAEADGVLGVASALAALDEGDRERMVDVWSDYLRASTNFERGYFQGRFEEYASQNAIHPDLFPALRYEAARRLDAQEEQQESDTLHGRRESPTSLRTNELS